MENEENSIEEHAKRFNFDGGYVNLLNKYGTGRDSSEAYVYNADPAIMDTQLTTIYEQNGLFCKIIDAPAEEALKRGIDLSAIADAETADYIENKLDNLNVDEQFIQALIWSRLYGGALAVMLIDDGGKLEDPLNIKKAKSIDEIRVYERSIVQPEYTSLYRGVISDDYTIGEPEYYIVSSVYGRFKVHKSRCLVFKNGKLPEQCSNENYRFWGVPEYVRIKKELRRTSTSHGNADKLLERAVQAVQKIKGLAGMLSTEAGEDMVLKRLQVIDMAKGLLNTIAIDADGEDYSYSTFSLSGVKDIVDVSCNMLSAITNIPQTILFGRAPAGMNATGESDLENYYNYVERIQRKSVKGNYKRLLNIICSIAVNTREIKEKPVFKLKFMPLWSLSEKEQAELDNQKADGALKRAQATQVYVDMQAVDPTEVRNALAKTGEYEIEDILDEYDIEEENTFEESKGSQLDLLLRKDDSKELIASAVLIVNDGKILVGNRDNGQICGPGGHIEPGETPLEAAVRETKEEFNITPKGLVPIGIMEVPQDYDGPVQLYLATEYQGEPQTDNEEMFNPRFVAPEDLDEDEMFYPFLLSIEHLVNKLTAG